MRLFYWIAINGIYAAANKIPNLIGSFYSVFNLAWTETASRCSEDKDKEQYYSKLYEVILDFLILCACFILASSDLIFKLLIDSKFYEGYYQMPILILGVIFNCLVSFYGGIYIALKKTKEVGVSSAIGAILNIVINVLAIKHIGIFAASVSTVVSFAIICIYRRIKLNDFIALDYSLPKELIDLIVVTFCMVVFYIKIPFSNIVLYLVAFIFLAYFMHKYCKVFFRNIKKKS